MNLELSTLKDGGVLLVSDSSIPDMVKRIEFYREQKLMMLVYMQGDIHSDLMHYEVPDEMLYSVERSPDIIIYTLFADHDPIGYKVPLIKVGEI